MIDALEVIAIERGYPKRIRVDNGPEFRSAALDACPYAHGAALEFIQPGKPIQNAVIESYNGRMRDELLNLHWWRTVTEDARRSPLIASTTGPAARRSRGSDAGAVRGERSPP